jgi:hypothetical protein
MNSAFGIGELDELDEAFDEAYDEAYDENDEGYDEAVRSRRPMRRPPVSTAGRRNAYRPRPDTGGVTQAQLKAALERVSAQIGTNSKAIKTVDGRVRGIASEQTRMTSALRKEVADRKKDGEVMRKEIQSAKELSVILPLIAKDNPVIGLLALSGGLGFGGSGSGGGDSTGNLLVLALALGGLGPKK